MKKFKIILGSLICFMAIGILSVHMYRVQQESVSASASALLAPTAEVNGDKVEEILQTMTLEEKLGQMLIFGFDSHEINTHAAEMLKQNKAGGVILFDRNMDNPAQVTQLNYQLQKMAVQEGHKLPLFICVDQEGGTVVRMGSRITRAPSAQQLGRFGTAEDAATFANMTAVELAVMGFNVNFAPVLDLAANNTRSYGEDPYRASELAQAAIKGYQSQHIIAAIKHFPGIGKAKVDLHVGNDQVLIDKEMLLKSDSAPFRQIIQSMDSNQFFVMVSHLSYPMLDPLPASVSDVMIHQLLRQELGYQGVIITDDMEMGALAKNYSFNEMGVLAVKAGVDILLVCHEQQHQTAVYQSILAAVHSGQITEERINDSVRRIIKLKLMLRDDEEHNPQEAERIVGSNEHGKLVEDFVRKMKPSEKI